VSGNQSHSWAIDSIEENSASVEIDGKAMAQLPKWMLPRAAKEGDVLAVKHELWDDGMRSTLSISVDAEATRKARERSTAVPAKTGKEKVDPGGDIKF
jgi:hypothetical protein